MMSKRELDLRKKVWKRMWKKTHYTPLIMLLVDFDSNGLPRRNRKYFGPAFRKLVEVNGTKSYKSMVYRGTYELISWKSSLDRWHPGETWNGETWRFSRVAKSEEHRRLQRLQNYASPST